MTTTLVSLCISLTIAPPPTIPPNHVIHTFDGENGDGWQLVNLDLQSATDLLTEFSKSYDHQSLEPDFSCSPVQRTNEPQGLLGLAKKNQVHAVFHYIEKTIGIAHISSIATPFDFDSSFISVLAETLGADDVVRVDATAFKFTQPRWYFALAYRNL